MEHLEEGRRLHAEFNRHGGRATGMLQPLLNKQALVRDEHPFRND
jgi:hypothetical protein